MLSLFHSFGGLLFFVLALSEVILSANARRHDRPPRPHVPNIQLPNVGHPSVSKPGRNPWASAGVSKPSGKRGLAYNHASLTLPFATDKSSKVFWTYNWYSFPYTFGQNQTGYNPSLSFVPMLWSTASDLTSVWTSNVNKSIANYKTDAVVAFNEPDLCAEGSSCMNLTAAVDGYRKWMNPLAGKVRLGSPSVTNGNGTAMGLNYLQSFLNQCPDCIIDFVQIHWYGGPGDIAAFKKHVRNAQKVAGNRPLWVTEFGLDGASPEQELAFLKEAMEWMDGQRSVERYAWFMDEVGNLIGDDGRGLSELGVAYNGQGGIYEGLSLDV